jgi:hypothetical protein
MSKNTNKQLVECLQLWLSDRKKPYKVKKVKWSKTNDIEEVD